MKRFLLCCLLLLLIGENLFSQDIPPGFEEQLESLSEEVETENDEPLVWELQRFLKNPLNINSADAADMHALLVLTDLQIDNFLKYRSLLGLLISLYELQAIPGWDPGIIKQILPYITIRDNSLEIKSIRKRLSRGEHMLLYRISGLHENARGFMDTSGYVGDKKRMLFRYRYNYKNSLQFGILGEKDAGEQFFGKYQSTGFDFYSAHLFIRKAGVVEAFTFGDFTVNMGQGLIQWHGLGMKKSADVMNVKRQSQVLAPYRSSGEFLFFRGGGMTIRKGAFDLTSFFSLKKLDANYSDVESRKVITSFLRAGYHRTVSEISKNNNTVQQSAGINISFKKNSFQGGLNVITHKFSSEIQKRDDLYNLFSFSGRVMKNASLDYSYTFRNVHFFGETAVDGKFNKAVVAGAVASVSTQTDISILYRNISPGYSSFHGNAFSENTNPVNETGFYTGMSIRPGPQLKFDVYADFFSFRWLKYLVDAPRSGREYLVQVLFTPRRGIEMYSRLRVEDKFRNSTNESASTNPLTLKSKVNWRTHMSVKLSAAATIRSRVEAVWVGGKEEEAEQGFMFMTDLLYKPLLRPYSFSCRVQFFETGGYDSRIYAYESDVMYSNSVPPISGKGFRTYINISYDITKRWSLWLRLARTQLAEPGAGTGLERISGKSKTEFKLQIRWVL